MRSRGIFILSYRPHIDVPRWDFMHATQRLKGLPLQVPCLYLQLLLCIKSSFCATMHFFRVFVFTIGWICLPAFRFLVFFFAPETDVNSGSSIGSTFVSQLESENESESESEPESAFEPLCAPGPLEGGKRWIRCALRFRRLFWS